MYVDILKTRWEGLTAILFHCETNSHYFVKAEINFGLLLNIDIQKDLRRSFDLVDMKMKWRKYPEVFLLVEI